jgi:hypothetical protein
MDKISYLEKLKDPRWQKKRLDIFCRDEWMCQVCKDSESMLVVHHKLYADGDPWDIDNNSLITLCQECHKFEHIAFPRFSNNLISAIKSKGFLADQVEILSKAFLNLNIIYAPEFTASLLYFAFSDKTTMEIILDRFYDYTEQRGEEKNVRNGGAGGEAIH